MPELQPIWLEISFEIDHAAIETAEDILLASGAHSVTLQDAADQPLLEPLPGETPLWNNCRIIGLFSYEKNLEMMLELIRHALVVCKPKDWRVNRFDDKDWVRVWMDDFKPMQFGDNLWICPSHLPPPKKNAVNLILDPGLAFGTGTHPTTALCLQWLAKNNLQDKLITDYGCGSGILGIAAVLLGAQHCTSIDIDDQALYATRENAKQNKVADKISTMSVETSSKLSANDIVIANILSGTLIALKHTLAPLVNIDGVLVMSGILQDQAQAVMDAYEENFLFSPAELLESWVLLVAKRIR